MYEFTKISYEEYEFIGDSIFDYEEEYVDEHRVVAVYHGKNCIAVNYFGTGVISCCEKFNGCFIEFVETDPHYPYSKDRK